MIRLSDVNIPNHFIERINMREQLIHQLDIIPVEVVVRNIATGSLVKRLGVKEGKILSRPITEFYLKDDELDDPIISEEHILSFEWANHSDLTGFFLSQQIRLVDFKLEFGRFWNDEEQLIMLADEISPDNCRLWDMQTNKKLDKDRFRQDLGNVSDAYKEVANRLGVLSDKEFKKVIRDDF